MFRAGETLEPSIMWNWDENTQRLVFSYKDQIQSEYQALFRELFPNINLDPSTPQGQIITSLTQVDMATISYLENLANGFFLGGYGHFMDIWAWNLFRVRRKEGKNATATIKINGIPGTYIPADFTITDEKYYYKIDLATTIPDDDIGEIEASFTCTELNDYIAPPQTINKMVTIVEGIERVENIQEATPAIFPETDEALFNRCVYFGSTAKNASFKSILANVANVPDVSRVGGYENVEPEPKTYKGVEIPAHTFMIVVDGGLDKDIAEAIFKSRATGCAMIGNTEVLIEDEWNEYYYKFERPTIVPIKVEVVIRAKSNYSTEFAGVVNQNEARKISQNIMNYINTMDIGGTLTHPEISQHLNKNVNGYYYYDTKFARKSASGYGYEPVRLKLNECAKIEWNDIHIYNPERTDNISYD